MNRTIVISAISISLLGSAAVLAQGQPQQPQQPMSFVATSAPPGTGNLGGLEGADKICQDLAAAAGAGNKTWHAYLSQEARGGVGTVNARGRIGTGPWYNAKGQLVASNVGDLHGDHQRDRSTMKRATASTEKGEIVTGGGGAPCTNRARRDDRLGLRRSCVRRRYRSHVQQLDLGRHDPAARSKRTGGSAGGSRACDAGPYGSWRQRWGQRLVERGAYEPGMHKAGAHQHGRRRQAVLLRDQLRFERRPFRRPGLSSGPSLFWGTLHRTATGGVASK